MKIAVGDQGSLIFSPLEEFSHVRITCSMKVSFNFYVKGPGGKILKHQFNFLNGYRMFQVFYPFLNLFWKVCLSRFFSPCDLSSHVKKS